MIRAGSISFRRFVIMPAMPTSDSHVAAKRTGPVLAVDRFASLLWSFGAITVIGMALAAWFVVCVAVDEGAMAAATIGGAVVVILLWSAALCASRASLPKRWAAVLRVPLGAGENAVLLPCPAWRPWAGPVVVSVDASSIEIRGRRTLNWGAVLAIAAGCFAAFAVAEAAILGELSRSARILAVLSVTALPLLIPGAGDVALALLDPSFTEPSTERIAPAHIHRITIDGAIIRLQVRQGWTLRMLAIYAPPSHRADLQNRFAAAFPEKTRIVP